jgi:hypothetical protein
MPRSVRRSLQRRKEDHIRLDSRICNDFPCFDRLFMAFLCQRRVSRAADLILKIPKGLSVPHKIKLSHLFSPSPLLV